MKRSQKAISTSRNRRVNVPTKVVNLLWLKAAGRCEFAGCNECLWMDGLTKNPCNVSNVAHIVAASSDGPRGDAVRSKKIAKDINNLMLLCTKHHKLIDSPKTSAMYPENLLVRMKVEHEHRIDCVCNIKQEMQAHVVLYHTKIGGTYPRIDVNSAYRSLLPTYYPVDIEPIQIEWTGVRSSDMRMYWQEEEKNLVELFRERIEIPSNRWNISRIALFAMAPMPLLVKLGSLLNDKIPVEVYQKHRNPDTWAWQDGDPVDFIVNAPQDCSKDPVLVFSLSYDITDRIKKYYGECASIWEFRIECPNNDFLRSKKQLEEFSKKAYEVLADIKLKTQKKSVKVFMSMPVACAVELGRVWMKKADVALDLYDYNKNFSEKDEFALTIR